MKRKRINIKDVPQDLYQAVIESPGRILAFLAEMNTSVPKGAELLLLCLKLTAPKFDIRFYGSQEDFLLDYTSCLLQDRADYEFHSFRVDSEYGNWEIFLPPPIVGLGVHSKLRPGIIF